MGVHFDSDEAIAAAPAAVSPDLDKVENGANSGGIGQRLPGILLLLLAELLLSQHFPYTT